MPTSSLPANKAKKKTKVTVTQTGEGRWDIIDEEIVENDNVLMKVIKEKEKEMNSLEKTAIDVEIENKHQLLDAWFETVNLGETHWLLANEKTAALFLPFEKFDTVPTKYHKYMAVVFPKGDDRDRQRLKIYIARTEKAREMWSTFVLKNPTAKKVDAIGIHQNGGMVDLGEWDVDTTTKWYTLIQVAIRARMKEFVTQPPLRSRRFPSAIISNETI